ncbi:MULTISPECIES: helix-turn-helix domain-containing protein [unclassified Bradyrhizobium]|uniref:AraC-like ligand-binding domain-containing protein n=1 Tax=unclassified Bradyrhizobium TaxID=2631580 RepID=UPI00247926B4|nr:MULTISPECIES: helix-turn-helix domain-containing protein [unclassified Bradyrhizobium]WGR74591.1 helix-turn-helix domain-containing protein [Bradyrhizobium sp. ISRA426]WGR79426.1 helix-turn-helix domain-containing protein [Bradyrhizobium sp. ISRA430]WGR89763.1 helix-turn-helix domain-containing protein [Bradyrhizobium sp. ISRA432]
MTIQFTTDGSPGHRRLALWQDIVCDVFVGLDCKSDLGSAFHGSVTRGALGKAVCSEVRSDRQHVFRTPSRIARSDQDFILIALGDRGAGGVVQDGRETVIRPGEFALYDTTRPYELKFDHAFTQTIFMVPRQMLQRRLGGSETLTAISFGADAPLERITYDFIYRLCQSADRIDPGNAAILSEQAVDLLAMALSERLGKTSLPSSTHRSALLYRLKAHIRAHLADPDLSLQETAAALGISPRYVNDLLADEDTSFQRHVLAERLAQCRRDLASPLLAHRHVSEIAFAWGFNDLSHFGRVFREHFGMSPREFRQSLLRH